MFVAELYPGPACTLLDQETGLFAATPSCIYAATPGDQANHGPSRRPAETVSPLAAKLGLQVNSKYGQGPKGSLWARSSGSQAMC
jgi:hypothetical protein